MKKFIVLYHSPADVMEQNANSTPEEQAKGIEAWMQWAEKCGDKLVDLGSPLMNGQEIRPDGIREKSEKDVSGYSILEAENLDEAISLLEDHPHLSSNDESSIEVHEVMPMPASM